jgi:dihydroorotate dehydrogenase electron transfer subunit
VITRRVKILRRIWYSPRVFGLEFNYPGIHPMPGQFFQIQVRDGIDPFLNRPISVASYKGSRMLLVIKVVGRGTRILSTKNEGDYITLSGPFGKRSRPAKIRTLLVAGGIGIAPLHYLAEYLHKRKTPFDLLYGVRNAKEFILRRGMTRMADSAFYVAEHGLKKRNTVVSALRGMKLEGYGAVYACGPRGMLIELQKLHTRMPIYALCEDFLGCGCGLCLGCAIMYKGEYKRICVDGPILALREIDFEM